jgi:hypothetical protein
VIVIAIIHEIVIEEVVDVIVMTEMIEDLEMTLEIATIVVDFVRTLKKSEY